ncbi:decaheme cytochrome c MtrF [Shewanella sp. ANA-3]|uniref:OmcA/MtrC family decaheme c-type cytochrome n=1 Tax=Shewanella sp. (strain ANA-3) TaxID=94122 RepID=UPI00005DC855|nr:OmcA/MtrC family decaheme c-type cytochrome [Shewanella sp. ANA-3]ABK48901.1 decaheme cytochrome c MtrF [Shewanella sp. ANA-3]
MNKFARFSTQFSLLLALTTLLTACGGSDGNDGSPGEPGKPPAMTITSLNIMVDKVAVTDGIAQVDYQVSNQDDEAVIGIPSATFIAAQLLPQGATGAGNSSEWQHFTSETCAASCPGTFVDHKNGHYSYRFSATFNGMNGVTFLNDATQRVVIKLGGDALADGTALPITNQHYDWQTSGNTLAYTRNLVTIETCNSCHSNLAFHGGRYNQVETCVTCHNSKKVSNPADIFPQMIHSKHLTGFPQSISNCQTCHVDNPDLAERQNWHRVPTMEACGACHTQINFPAGQGHPAQADNSNCVACHNADWTASVHGNEDQMAALAQFSPSISSASMDANGTVTVAVTLSNPATGTVYSESADKLKFISDLRVYANWGTSFDYSTRSARSIRLPESTPVSGSNGTYTYTISGLTVPAGTEADHGGLAIQGRVCAKDKVLVDCSTELAEVLVIKASHSYFDMSALSATGRREVISNANCASCHGDQQLNIHGARNDLAGQCQLCHNPNMQADATAANPSITSFDFKQLIHGIHTSQFAGFEDLNYPGKIGNCAQCHIKDAAGVSTVALPLNAAVQPLALNNGTFTSPIAAVCSNCHSSDTTHNHMMQQGAVFAGTKADATAGTETCAFCHGQGAVADVLKVHPIK